MEFISNPKQSISILLVEDDEPTLDCLAIILNKKYPDATIYSACNGKTGLELFKEHLPDIVITDINMPEMNGVQMANELRAIKPTTKIIVLTGDCKKHLLQDSVEKGFKCDHFIVKPVVIKDLFAAIENCLGD